uniref:AAA+ ATPase domain-containing protein n=1 Tax=Cannabis sativa TaxID=3483 RepID=A0A803Q7I1_CANSA
MTEKEKTKMLKKAHNAMVLNLWDKVLCEVSKEKTTFGFWKKSKSLCMTNLLANSLFLKQKLHAFKMTARKSVEDHLDEFNKIILDLENNEIKIKDEDNIVLNSLPTETYEHDTMTYGNESLTLKESYNQNRSGDAGMISDGDDSYGYGSARVLVVSNSNSKIGWVIDSGCSFHICLDKSQFNEYQMIEGGTMRLGDNRSCSITGHDVKKSEIILAGRINKTILGRVRCMLIQADLPKSFWEEVVTTTCYLISRSPSSEIQFKTPIKAWIELEQLDVKTTFLHGDLEEEIHMRQPEGYGEMERKIMPDLSHGVSATSRFMGFPGTEHRIVVKWLLRYLKGTMNVGLINAPNTSNIEVEGFMDSDYAVHWKPRWRFVIFRVSSGEEVRDVKILTERLDILEKYQKEVITMVESAKQKDKDVYSNVLEWIEKTQNDLSEYREKVKCSSQNFSHFVVHPQAMIDVDSLSKSINESIKHCVEFRHRISYYSRYYDKDYMSFETRRSILERVIDALKDPNGKIIGIYGMGGIGKTTLAKEIARQAKKEANLFDKVIMGSAVSQKPNFANIQCEIANDLGVQFGNYETELTKSKRLKEELGKQEKVLIILDDIWQKINLSDIGIDFTDDQTGCKILFTSRRQGLYSPAVEFALHSLQEDESTKLFRKVVDKTLDKNHECRPLLSELVNECGGVPIVINVVAAALKDAPSFQWRAFLNALRNSAPAIIEGMESNVFRSINVGWPLLENVDTLGDARDKLHTLIATLRKHCLLLPSDKSESHIRYHWVKLHDVIRDVLKSVASERNWFPLSKQAKNGELPIDVNATSLLNDFTEKLPDKLACPNLVSFIDEFDKKKLLSDCFFAETKMLKVLKLYHVDLRSPPSSLSCLFESLETLCLNSCDLEDTSLLGGFKKLKCLDLSESRFKTLSKQVGQLTHLKLLNLDDCEDLEVIEPDVISSLKNLEELYMRDVKIAWEVEKVSSERSYVSLAELKNLPRLNTLYLKIQNDTCLSKDFISRNIKRYQITVGKPHSSFGYDFPSYPRAFMLELHNANLIKECGFDKLMKECQALQLGGCEDVTIDIYVSNADGFPELEVFHLRDASNVRYLMECNHLVFQNLKKLKLTRLPNLQKMYAGELVAGSFSKLKEVKVRECHTLKSLFPISTIAGQLEEMEVESCDMMENIVFDRRENGTHQKIEFLKLQKLVLKELPKLTQFCKVEWEQNFATSSSLDSSPSTSIFPFFMGEVVAFPILEQLRLSSLDCVEMIWQDQVQEVSYMQNLKDINVEKCHELKYLFSSVVARSLAQLKALKVEECENMQEIIVIKEAGNEEGSSMETICFPKLEKVNLSSLPNVKTFSGGKRLAIKCPSLKILDISRCPKLKTFQKSCSNEIEAAEEPLFNEKVHFTFYFQFVFDACPISNVVDDNYANTTHP